MDHEDFRRSQVPAFGSWDVDALPFTQCFESARQAGLLRYPPRDLYVAADLYQNDVVTPAVILLPRPTPRQQTKAGGQAHAKIKERQHQHQHQHQHPEWGFYESSNDYEYDIDVIKDPPSPPPPPPPPRRAIAKAVDEDLYKVPSEFLRPTSTPTPTPNPKRKGGLGFFSSCLMPVCV